MTQRTASDRKDVRAAEKAAKAAEAERAEVLRTVMFTPTGRQWIWDQLTACHIFDPNTIESVRLSALWDGERNVGLRLLNDVMRFTPDQFILAMREANERHDRNNRNPDPSRDRGSAAELNGSQDSGRDVEGSVDYDPYDNPDSTEREREQYIQGLRG